MKSITIVLLALLAVAFADNWAVLICGSEGYGNYRHHADTCHAYQIMKKHGIPDSNIITFLYDDVAQNPRNPFPGELYNKPGDDSAEVYKGCPKDYTKQETTAANVVKVLTGEGSGKVLKSGPNDNVFVFYTDHGSTGIVAMPVGGTLTAKALNDAFLKMKSKNMYKKLVFYLEACNSGSMFENILDDNINIYATSASHARESSWGCYCPPQDVVKGKHVGSCLGDLYSVNWMEDSDIADFRTRTIGKQFEIVKEKTTRSQVCEWGQKSIKTDPIGMYQSRWTQEASKLRAPTAAVQADFDKHPIDSRDATLHSLYYSYLNTNDETVGKELKDHIAARLKADTVFPLIAGEYFEGYSAPKNFECAEAAMKALENSSFGRYDDYSIQYHRVIVNMCENLSTEEVVSRIRSVV